MKPYMLLAILHFSFSILNSSAAVPLRWTVETSRIQPAAFDVVRGETVSLEAHFKSYGTPVATSNMTAFLCWQTNGMAGAWWVTNAVTAADAARVLFTPQMDPGAATVNAFIGLSDEQPNNLTTQQPKHISYRAAFTLRFRHGPGATPNAIETPPRVLDLANTVVVNPPWPTQDDFAATTTVMRAELKDYVDQEIEGAGVVSPQTVTNIVDAKIAAIPKEGVSTNAVSEIITNHVTSGYLATGQELENYRAMGDNVCHATTGLWTVDDFPEGVTDIQTPVWDSSRSRWTIVYSLNGTVVNGWNSNYPESATEISHPVMDGRFRIGYIHYLKRGSAATYGQPFVTVDNVPSTNGLVTASVATNAAASVFSANADYALTNLTGASVSLASGQIGNLSLDAATSNLTIALDFSANTDRSGDAMLYIVNAADTYLAIGPAASVTPIGYRASEALKAGTNIVLVTRMVFEDGKSVVNVAIKEIR